jgi:hypothetical protein
MCDSFPGDCVGCRYIHPVKGDHVSQCNARPDGAQMRRIDICKAEVTYHVEGDDIFEGDLASLVFLDEDLVNADGRGAGRKPENKWVLGSGCECLDSI